MSPLIAALALATLTPEALIAGQPFALKHAEPVTSVAVSPDGTVVATASRDKTVRLWKRESGEVLQTIAGGQEQLSVVRFSADGALLALGDSGYQVRVVEVKSGEVKRSIAHPGAVSDVAFSPDAKFLAVGGNNDTGALYALADGARRFELRGRTVSWSADGKQLLLGNGVGSLVLVDAASGKVKKTYATAPHLPWATWSQDGKVIVSWNGTERDIRLWTPAGKEAGLLAGPPGTGFEGARVPLVADVALSPDGATLVSSAGDGLVRVWDVKAKKVKKTFPGDSPTSVALSRDGRWLFVADGRMVKFWSLAP